jgi:hypothetical protein
VYREIGGDGVVRDSSGAVVLVFGGIGRVGVRRWRKVSSRARSLKQESSSSI